MTLLEQNSFILLYTIIIPIAGMVALLPISETKGDLLHKVALKTSLVNFVVSILLWIQFDKLTTTFQFVNKLGWIPFANIDIYIGIDGISLFFILLTTLVNTYMYNNK